MDSMKPTLKPKFAQYLTDNQATTFRPKSGNYCPIAKWLTDRYGAPTFATYDNIIIHRNYKVRKTPQWAIEFMCWFDTKFNHLLFTNGSTILKALE